MNGQCCPVAVVITCSEQALSAITASTRLLLTTCLNSWETTSQPTYYIHLLTLPFSVCLLYARTHLLGQRSFSYVAPSVWNTLLYEIRSSNTLSSSNHLLKPILSSSPTDCVCVWVCVCVCVCVRLVQLELLRFVCKVAARLRFCSISLHLCEMHVEVGEWFSTVCLFALFCRLWSQDHGHRASAGITSCSREGRQDSTGYGYCGGEMELLSVTLFRQRYAWVCHLFTWVTVPRSSRQLDHTKTSWPR